MSKRNGVCKKDKFGVRIHTMKIKMDGEGRKFEACDRCGAFFVK